MAANKTQPYNFYLHLKYFQENFYFEKPFCMCTILSLCLVHIEVKEKLVWVHMSRFTAISGRFCFFFLININGGQ